MSARLLAGLDLGGTSVKVIVGTGPEDIAARFRIPTASPHETLDALVAVLEPYSSNLAGIGLSAFGPLQRDPHSPDYGKVLATPKPGWSGTDLLAPFRAAFVCPVEVDTDVNGALRAEARWGAAQGLANAAYLTIGTGVGGAILSGGLIAGGPGHAELGHVKLARDPVDQRAFSGACPFHGDCIEGLVSAPAIEARWGAPPDALDDTHPAWAIVANDLAALCLALTYSVRPDRIILGGGVPQREGLIRSIGDAFVRLAAGYALHPAATAPQAYIVPPGLGQDAGALGGFCLFMTG